MVVRSEGGQPERTDAECRAARRRMLEASPAELEPTGGAPLSAHLARCPSCARRADRLRHATLALDAWLSEPGELDVDQVLARARAPRTGGQGDPAGPSARAGGVARPSHDGMRRLRRGLAVAAPLAAALTGLWLVSRTPPPGADPDSPPAGASEPATPPPVEVDVPAGRSALVVRGRRSDLTVVLFFQGDEP